MKSRVSLETHGCSASTADSEMIAGMLEKAGYQVVNGTGEADLNILVTCTVKTVTAQRMAHRIKKLTQLGKPLVVAGCMPSTEKDIIEKISPSASLLGPHAIDRSVETAEAALSGKKLVATADSGTMKLLLPRRRRQETVGIVEIASGCLSSCTFCQTKLAKGWLKSYPVEMVVAEVEQSLRDGCKEVWLTSTDTGCYGKDIDTSLPELLNTICALRGDFKVRVGMMNPMYLGNSMENLVTAYGDEKVFKFLHIPVQSGSPRILREMKRGHTVQHFLDIVRGFRERYPSLSLSTDLIPGFPSESEQEFQMSMDLLDQAQPDVVNISRFGSRPGTEAAEMPQIDPRVVKGRSGRLHTQARAISLKRNRGWIGWRGSILVDEQVKGAFVGRNFAYRPVLLKEDTSVGAEVEAEIVDASSACLIGEIV